MAAPQNLQISFSPITVNNGSLTVIDGTVLHISGDSSTNTSPIDPAQVYISVTAQPSVGWISVNGLPGSDFTLAQAQAGLVLYHSSPGAATSDSFSVWARCNDSSTALPLAPHFVVTAAANAAGSQQVGLYFGAMLVGTVDANIFRAHFSVKDGQGTPFTVTTTDPNSILLVCALLSGSNIGTAMPPTFTVTGISFAGLSFSRLSQQTHNIFEPSSFVGSGAMANYTMEVWWTRAPAPASGAFTLTTQPLGVEGTVLVVDVTVFSGLANSSAPFDTNASNLQQFMTFTPPWTGLVMSPNAPEYRVLPWVYELVAGNLNAVSPIGDMPGAVPQGYGTVNGLADNINNTYVWHSAGRGPANATAAVTISGSASFVPRLWQLRHPEHWFVGTT